MNPQQTVFAFYSPRRGQPRPEFDASTLVGRSYLEDDYVTVTVVSVCQTDHQRVVVRRRPGGSFTMPAWLVRSIFEIEDKAKRRAA
jgi:hypothetical protein